MSIEAWFINLQDLITQFPIKDIFVNAIGSFIGGIALLWLTMSKHGIRYLKSKLERPSVRIETRKTPENIFKGIDLGAPARWVEQQLGVPTRIRNNWWGYRFSDSLVSLSFDSNDSIEMIAVALIDNKTTFEFPSWHFNCPSLGKLTLRNLLEEEHLTLEFSQSTRHSELMVSGREGPRGAWHYIAFGALSPYYPGPLLSVEFDWDNENKMLLSKPEDVKINWAAISATSNIDGFQWDLGLTN